MLQEVKHGLQSPGARTLPEKKQANKHFYHLQYTTVLEKKFPEGSFFHFSTGKHSWIQCKLTKVFFLAILSVLFMS